MISENKQHLWCKNWLFSKDKTKCRLTVPSRYKVQPSPEDDIWFYNTEYHKIDINTDWEGSENKIKIDSEVLFYFISVFLKLFYFIWGFMETQELTELKIGGN